MLSLKQFEDREVGLYKNARKARLEHLVKAVARFPLIGILHSAVNFIIGFHLSAPPL